MDNSEEFERFRPLIGGGDSAYNFLCFNYLGKVLDSFEKVELVDEHTKRKYAAVGKNISIKGSKAFYPLNLRGRMEILTRHTNVLSAH